MQDTQHRSTLELGKILSTYFRLSPDRYAKEHFQNYLENSSNSFDPQVSWDWLKSRIQNDSVMIKEDKDLNSIPDGFDWADFEPDSIASVLSGFGRNLEHVNEFVSVPQNSLPSSDISHTSPPFV